MPGLRCHSVGPSWVAMNSRKIRRISSAMLSPWSSAKWRNQRPSERGIGSAS